MGDLMDGHRYDRWMGIDIAVDFNTNIDIDVNRGGRWIDR